MKAIYHFSEGSRSMQELLGGKGANLAEMTNLGLPVPPGYIITTEACRYFLENNSYPQSFEEEHGTAIRQLENDMGKKFGDPADPLLVSVRSGAAVSMPGMMDTILNLGLNDESVEGLATKTQNPRFAYDAYRRFIQMFSNVVLGLDMEKFEHILEEAKKKRGYTQDTQLTAEDLKELIDMYKQIVMAETGQAFPSEPMRQLDLAILAVFGSWDNERAIKYRRINNIHGLLGTAVNVQAMVYGNMGETSGTGVAFTRNPSNGDREFFGEFLCNAQGEDVVAGIRTPNPIAELEQVMPEVYATLIQIKDQLEKHYADMQDIEFTIQEGRLFILQTRNGKRTARAALRIAIELVEEGLINKETAVMKVDPHALEQLLHPQLDPTAQKNVIARGLPASPGAATGKIVFTADEAVYEVEQGEKVILVRRETSPEDIHGMHVAEGILTSTGGMTSHAAVVARGMGKTCIAGCADLQIDAKAKTIKAHDQIYREGDILTLDGTSGEVIVGDVPKIESEISGDLQTILEWADDFREMHVRANADTPHDAEVARKFGAQGIGLCRTEHMFFDESRIDIMRKVIVSTDEKTRRAYLEELLPFQKEDFAGLFKVMAGHPVTIRLLDPPLHEFLPNSDAKILELAEGMGMTFQELKTITENLHEVNPMLGHRGCRLGITYPEIYEMQVRAITEAAIEVSKHGETAIVEIEVPLIATASELKHVRQMIESVVSGYGSQINFIYKVGTMIEIPRACLTANEIAEHADFFSFGTNDLTQTTFGISRDDAGKFISYYVDHNIIERDPAETIDVDGVGKLMHIAVTLGRENKPDLEVGICGEQGGDPKSIEFCQKIGLNYVSCSPYRVPVARLAAAQAAIKLK